MEPLGDTSNTPKGAPLTGTRKSGKKSGLSRDGRRSLLTPGSNGTPNSAGRRNGSRLGGRRLDDELEGQAGRRASQANLLDPEQVAALYHQCIKLATENKISSKNTWALGLIDHLHDLVQPTQQEGSTTNFQRASITLGAGIEIYAKRVDSIHTEAFKVLGGLCRGGAPIDEGGVDDAGNTDGDESGDGRPDNGRAARKAAMLRDVNPSSTLEPSFDSLNVKKIDLAFTVDPLFHKTSAQFDEGGARGLLLFNLSVCRGCEIVFDSQEVPDGSPLFACQPEEDLQVDVGPLAGQIAEVMIASQEARMCPAMDDLSALLGRSAEREFAADAERLVAKVPDVDRLATSSGVAEAPGGADVEMHAAEVEGHESEGDQPLSDGGSFAARISDDEEADGVRAELGEGDASDWGHGGEDEGMEGADGPTWMTQQPFDIQGAAEEDFSADQEGAASGLATQTAEEHTSGFHAPQACLRDPAGLVRSTKEQSGMDAVQWLVSGVESLTLDGRDWAGASHWRYRTRQNPEGDPTEASAAATAKQPKPKRKRGDPLDFNNLAELPEGALALADAKSITLKTWGSKAPTLLPEDLHYKASSLAELFLQPGRLVFDSASSAEWSRGAADSDRNNALAAAFGGEGGGGDFAGGPGEDDEEGSEGGGWGDIDFGDIAGLVEAPRKVAQIGINYARAAKQVDVRALKQTLWHVIGEQHDQQQAEGGGKEVAFQDVLGRLSPENVNGSISDLSVHLCFICLLHLANENGLRITGAPTLDRLTISGVPTASTV